MAAQSTASAEKMCNEFVNYLFEEYSDNRHVRRVASWIGLIVLGIDKVKDTWARPRSRQLKFEIDDKRYKAKYDHSLGSRGGVAIVEIQKSRGEPEVQTVEEITDLYEARTFFQDADRVAW